jgi:hypothetical protein
MGSRQKRGGKGWALALTLGLALWGARGNPGRWGIVLCCAGIVGCIWYELWSWAVGGNRSAAEKIGRSVALTIVSLGAAGFYGWQFWPPWRPSLHVTGYTLYAQTVGTPLRVGVHILNDSDDTITTTGSIGTVGFIDGDDREQTDSFAEKAFAKTEMEFAQDEKRGGLIPLEVPPKANMHLDVDSSPKVVVQTTLDSIAQSNITVVFAGVIQYTDNDNNTVVVPYCGFTDARTKSIPNCRKHNTPYIKPQ